MALASAVAGADEDAAAPYLALYRGYVLRAEQAHAALSARGEGGEDR